MSHDHDHDHAAGGDHAGHDHGAGGHNHGPKLAMIDAPRWLWVALGLNVAMTVVEAVVGVIAHSTALLADSAHVITDALAIGVAILAIRIAKRPASRVFTYGFGRIEILSAQLNGALLLVLAVALGAASLIRLLNPPTVDGALVVYAGVFGLLGNGGAAWALAKASRRSQAVEGAFQHTLMDALASIAAIIAGAVVLAGGPDAVDPLLALLVTLLMLRSGWQILVNSTRVLLEGAPVDVNAGAVRVALSATEGVVAVRDLHVWQVTDGFPAVTAQIEVRTDVDCHATRAVLQALLRERFDIDHLTLQVDHTGAPAGGQVCDDGGAHAVH